MASFPSSSYTNNASKPSPFRSLFPNAGKGTVLVAMKERASVDQSNSTGLLDKAGGRQSSSTTKRLELITEANNNLKYQNLLETTEAIQLVQGTIGIQLLNLLVCCFQLAPGVPPSSEISLT